MYSIVILLGSPNDKAGKLSSIAVERCLLALKVFKQNPDSFMLPTGGFGPHFNTSSNPHTFYTRAFWVAKGVPHERILEGIPSRFTLEDAELARPNVDRHGVRDLIIVTSDFHLERAKLIFNRVFEGYELTFLGSETELPKPQLRAPRAHEKKAVLQLKAAFSGLNAGLEFAVR